MSVPTSHPYTPSSTSGFMRLKLGKELSDRKVSSHIFETHAEAQRNLGESGEQIIGGEMSSY